MAIPLPAVNNCLRDNFYRFVVASYISWNAASSYCKAITAFLSADDYVSVSGAIASYLPMTLPFSL